MYSDLSHIGHILDILLKHYISQQTTVDSSTSPTAPRGTHKLWILVRTRSQASWFLVRLLGDRTIVASADRRGRNERARHESILRPSRKAADEAHTPCLPSLENLRATRYVRRSELQPKTRFLLQLLFCFMALWLTRLPTGQSECERYIAGKEQAGP